MLRAEEERVEKAHAAIQQDAERRMEVCGRMVMRMKAAQLAAAFASFVDAASRSVSARISVGRVLRRIKAGQLAAAFDGLTTIVWGMKRSRATCEKVVGRLKFGRMRAAYSGWGEYVLVCRLAAAEEGIQIAKQRMVAEADGQVERVRQTMASECLREKERRLELCRRTVQVHVRSSDTSLLDAAEAAPECSERRK